MESLAAERDRWDLILTKLKSQEMPPEDVLRPDQEIHTLVKFLEREFARADAAMKPDPGRVTARRLNRSEGHEHDPRSARHRVLSRPEFSDRRFRRRLHNIADVLTVSPVLMEKDPSAAERIADRAVAARPLPKPIEVEYSLRFRNLRRLDPSTVEATHRFDFDADYETQDRPARWNARRTPRQSRWGSGWTASSRRPMSIETKPSGLVYFNPYSEEEIRVAITEGDHTLRLGLVARPVREDACQGRHLQATR